MKPLRSRSKAAQQLFKFEDGQQRTPDEAGVHTVTCRILTKRGLLTLVKTLGVGDAYDRARAVISKRQHSLTDLPWAFREVYQLTPAGRERLGLRKAL